MLTDTKLERMATEEAKALIERLRIGDEWESELQRMYIRLGEDIVREAARYLAESEEYACDEASGLLYHFGLREDWE